MATLLDRLRALVDERAVIDDADAEPSLRPLAGLISSLPDQLRLELLYGIACARQDGRCSSLTGRQLEANILALRAAGTTSLLEHDESAWPRLGGLPPAQLRNDLLIFVIDRLEGLLGVASLDHEVTRDRWRMRRLGFSDERSRRTVLRFDAISPCWLREAAKLFLLWRIRAGWTSSALLKDIDVVTGLAGLFASITGGDTDPARFASVVADRFLGEEDVHGQEARCVTGFVRHVRDLADTFTTAPAATPGARARTVDIAGHDVEVPAGARRSTALPNGFCRLPLTVQCPRPNACLTCGDFATSKEHLDTHRERLANAELVVRRATARGEIRQREIHQRVATNLSRIISALDAAEDVVAS